MSQFRQCVQRLRERQRLSGQDYKALLQDNDRHNIALLHSEARAISSYLFGNSVYIRGLLEIGNCCRNDCLYCGIRASNYLLNRYRLTPDEILDCCRRGYGYGFRTFVLQGGEDPKLDDMAVVELVRSIRSSFPDCAVTLSLGERTEEAYRLFREAGADRYLLRHETYNPDHYSLLHPSSMSRENRLRCLMILKGLGYQTGTGIMVGSPYQTLDNIVEDLLFIQDFHPEMIGIGPFIHHPDTPFSSFPDGSLELTLKLISIFRLMNPGALIPATTALATIDPEGRRRGILAGANVVMPNLTPVSRRQDYALYEGKNSSGAESAEGLEELKDELHAIGYEVVVGRGDYREPLNVN